VEKIALAQFLGSLEGLWTTGKSKPRDLAADNYRASRTLFIVNVAFGAIFDLSMGRPSPCPGFLQGAGAARAWNFKLG